MRGNCMPLPVWGPAASRGIASSKELGPCRELFGILTGGGNASVRLVEGYYEAIGLQRGVGGAAPPLGMRELSPPAQPWVKFKGADPLREDRGEGPRYDPPLWVRDIVTS